MSQISVLGAGAWGTALARSLAERGGHTVTLWTRSAAAAAEMLERRENKVYLPGISLPDSLNITAYPGEAISEAEIVVSAVPSEHLRATFAEFASLIGDRHILVSATKGLEDGTLLRMTEVMQQVIAPYGLRNHCGVLSGPSFAQEVAAGLPTALTVAFSDASLAGRVQSEFSGASLRLYTNEDVVGVELGGALKNIVAIAAGVVAGLNLGHNTAAALITRGIAEMTRLAVACGGRRETLAGLAGIGDLVLTCTGALSRNRLVGMELGRGRPLAEIMTSLHGKVAEGVRTTFAALDLARKLAVEMPITEQMAAILGNNKDPREAIRELMSRRGRDE